MVRRFLRSAAAGSGCEAASDVILLSNVSLIAWLSSRDEAEGAAATDPWMRADLHPMGTPGVAVGKEFPLSCRNRVGGIALLAKDKELPLSWRNSGGGTEAVVSTDLAASCPSWLVNTEGRVTNSRRSWPRRKLDACEPLCLAWTVLSAWLGSSQFKFVSNTAHSLCKRSWSRSKEDGIKLWRGVSKPAPTPV